MAMTVKALVLMVVVMSTALFGVTLGGTVHTIGGSAGWTTMGNIDYAKWASSQKFMVGDTLVFNYNKQYHNVLQVTHQEYHSCNVTSAPIATYVSGSDSIAIKTTGHFYYLCGVPGHCQKGQKVDIRVTQASTIPSPAPAPLAGTPAPIAQSNAPVLRSVKLWLVIGFLAALLCFGN